MAPSRASHEDEVLNSITRRAEQLGLRRRSRRLRHTPVHDQLFSLEEEASDHDFVELRQTSGDSNEEVWPGLLVIAVLERAQQHVLEREAAQSLPVPEDEVG